MIVPYFDFGAVDVIDEGGEGRGVDLVERDAVLVPLVEAGEHGEEVGRAGGQDILVRLDLHPARDESNVC